MELVRFPSRGGFSVRSIFTFALTVIVTALLWVVLATPSTHAVTPTATNATWTDGDALLFDNHAYNRDDSLAAQSDAIPEGSAVYKAPIQTEGSDRVLMVIYFAPGVDPPAATSATFLSFDSNNGQISDSADTTKDITVSPKGSDDTLAGETNSSCSVSGIGWIVCPVTVFLAEGMDWLYTTIFEQFTPAQTLSVQTENNALYTAWNVMRTIANVAFVIAFLIIIYAQLTSMGVSNYGIKKLTPRLIVAAVLVNLSFYISAIAIDISNIIGYSIHDIFVSIRESVFMITDDTNNMMNANPWANVTGVVLAGGGVIGGVYYLATAGPYILVTLLVALGLTSLLVVLVLAARQAIIIILVIVSPLAFVANLLPNTEKWFERWRDLFMTMLIFFPAFALVWSGSQLAGQLIIMNAGGNILTLIFGLAVQVAPLVITPYLLKFSGGLLGRIAQMTNNPNKGILDRTRGWQKERNEMQRQNSLGKTPWGGKAAFLNSARPSMAAKRMENNRRGRKEKLDLYKQRADNQWHESKKHEEIHKKMHVAEVEKEIISTRHKQHLQAETNRVGTPLHLQNVQLEAAKRALDETMKISDADIKEYAAGYKPAGASIELQRAINQMQASSRNATIEGMRASKADGQAQRDLAEALKNSAALRDRAGGIQPLGASSVLASAVSAVRRADAEDIKNIMDASDLNAGDLKGAADRMVAAINAGNSIEARAYQNMLVTAGGAGLEMFRDTMITKVGKNIPADISEYMRDNLLSNHGALKAKGNDLITWAAKGGILEQHTFNGKDWAGLSDKDFIGQHPKAQAYAFKPGVDAFSAERARSILEADVVEGNVLTIPIKNELRKIAGLPLINE